MAQKLSLFDPKALVAFGGLLAGALGLTGKKSSVSSISKSNKSNNTTSSTTKTNNTSNKVNSTVSTTPTTSTPSYTSLPSTPISVSVPAQSNSAVSNSEPSYSTGYLPLGSNSFDMEQYYQMMREASEYNTAMSVQMARENNAFNAQQAALSREFNATEAAKNRDWQELMSNTAHQREVNDLKAAGLNPVLSAMGGNGAAVTSGASASSTPTSGTKGEVDKSYVQGVASLLGSLVAAQASMLNTVTSAQNNLAVADKYNATSELVAQLNAAAGIQSAGIHAGGTVSAAQISSEAHKIAAALALEGTKYSSDNSRAISQYLAELGLTGDAIRAVSSIVGGAMHSNSYTYNIG